MRERGLKRPASKRVMPSGLGLDHLKVSRSEPGSKAMAESYPPSASRRKRCSSCASAGSATGGAPERAGLPTSPRSSPAPGRTSGKSRSTRSQRSASTGRTTSSACYERRSPECLPPGDVMPANKLVHHCEATPMSVDQLEPRRDQATVDDVRLPATSPA